MAQAGVRIRVNAKAASAALREMSPATRREMVKGYNAIGVMLRGQLVAASPRDTGTLADAHNFAVDAKRLRLHVFNTKEHAVYVHDGRKAGSHPPPKALFAWARRKLGSPGAAYAVAHAIARRGIKARPWFDTTIQKNVPVIKAILQNSLDAVVAQANRGA